MNSIVSQALLKDRLRLLLIQGQNLALLGYREPELYGTTTAAELDAQLLRHASDNNYHLEIHYADTQEAVLAHLSCVSNFDGLLMNPGGFSDNGRLIATRLNHLAVPYVEIHLTNLEKRGLHSLMASKALGVIMGFGVYSYFAGLNSLLYILRQ
jgi:3-dehydroquinate dehydratase II